MLAIKEFYMGAVHYVIRSDRYCSQDDGIFVY